ncbi:MAG TPA: serine/threonine-protein kinase [Allosphingosinicella sp.]|nr:serine/threonine-protein kinase [Allosphingosinicella sp.]
MSDDKDKKPPEEGEERTVFMPGGGSAQPPAPAPPPADEPTARATPPPATPQAGFVPHKDAATIKVGDVLNHIFEVKSFLGRGGMGEVFVGCNVNTDEKVAIKVMLPALASDEKVIAMFRKEARTLTKLHHQALVQYRVLAQEPQLHVLYIVTDFIEGTNLGAALGKITPSPEELAGLLRRLASGLQEAHALGAVHRDMSPDNVILENDDIHDAKIIDFGIAKDMDASSATIVGDGFAGKLNYVAPEQLGDFGREVGPWTDVYSLGLVILAVAQGRNVDMSGSLVDAIDKRRCGPDIAAIPDSLRPLLAAMLRPDPKERLRSMDDVLAMLDGARIPSPTTVREEVAEAATLSSPDGASGGGRASKSRPLLIVLAVLAGAAALLAAGWYATGSDFGLDGWFGAGPTGNESGNAVVPAPENRSPADTARAAIASVLPSVPCTWLDIGAVQEGAPLNVAMRGVAGNEGAAQAEIGRALAGAGLAGARLDFRDVATIAPGGCAALDTYRQFRAGEPVLLASTAPRYEMVTQADGPYLGRPAANALVDLNLAGEDVDFALFGIEPSGRISNILGSRAAFQNALAGSSDGRPISDEGNGRYRLHVDLDHEGWSGLLLVTGRGPFPPAMVAPELGARGPDWRDRFADAAGNLGWRTQMVWFESVNREPDATIAAIAEGDKEEF